MKGLAAWEWPGNIRELENFIERAVILTRGKLLEAPPGRTAQVEHGRTCTCPGAARSGRHCPHSEGNHQCPRWQEECR